MLPKNFKIILIEIIFLLVPSMVFADYLNQKVDFFVDPSYDLVKREKISATLYEISPQLYFYIDDNWWNGLDSGQQNKVKETLYILSQEFEGKIYPTLTSIFGTEWKPGIDNDNHITILIHPLIKEAGGYFNSGDEYPKIQSPKSNEREMFYLNAQNILDPISKIELAHEFIHLIIFYQKEKLQGVSEDVWLNEARAEYVATLLNYNDIYDGSNLQTRVKNLLGKPYDSLTEWLNLSPDYGVVSLFIHYLVEQYGINILSQSLKLPQAGIQSLNSALFQSGYKENFAQIFTNWVITVLLNDCEVSKIYCYSNPNLKNFRITPLTNFLPLLGESTLKVNSFTKDWAGNWFKFVGGHDTLKIEFSGEKEGKFKIPYVIYDYLGGVSVNFLDLDTTGKGEIYISDFGIKNTSVVIMPLAQNKISGFSDIQPSYSFSWSASVQEKPQSSTESELIKSLLAQIAALEKEIAILQAKIQAILSQRTSCQKFEENLYFGMKNNSQVSCLQEFLKSLGSEIYPGGLVTGYFGSLTQAAVIRFQEKYKEEILTPLGLEKGTGFVGEKTRFKINQLLGY